MSVGKRLPIGKCLLPVDRVKDFEHYHGWKVKDITNVSEIVIFFIIQQFFSTFPIVQISWPLTRCFFYIQVSVLLSLFVLQLGISRIKFAFGRKHSQFTTFTGQVQQGSQIVIFISPTKMKVQECFHLSQQNRSDASGFYILISTGFSFARIKAVFT